MNKAKMEVSMEKLIYITEGKLGVSDFFVQQLHGVFETK